VDTPRDMCSAITCTNSSDLHHCLLSDSVALTRQGDYVTMGPGIDHSLAGRIGLCSHYSSLAVGILLMPCQQKHEH
jgi:hypothetical protein